MDIVLTFSHLQIIQRELSLLKKSDTFNVGPLAERLSTILSVKEEELKSISGIKQRFLKRGEKIIIPISFQNLRVIHQFLEKKMSFLSKDIKIDFDEFAHQPNVNVTDSLEGKTAWFYSYLNTFMAIEYYITKYRSLEH